MKIIETLREMSEIWRLFGDMPDDATLNVELASLYPHKRKIISQV